MQNFRVTVNGKVFEVTVEDLGAGSPSVNVPTAPVTDQTATPELSQPVESSRETVAVSDGDKRVDAPLSGNILAIKVKPGDHVKYGQVLLTLEALKMENEIVAPEDAVVKEIYVQTGSAVKVGDLLITLA